MSGFSGRPKHRYEDTAPTARACCRTASRPCLRKANIYAPHFYRHLVSKTRILGKQAGVITAQTNYGVFQTLPSRSAQQESWFA